jgi:hypothetical protein
MTFAYIFTTIWPNLKELDIEHFYDASIYVGTFHSFRLIWRPLYVKE